MQSMTGPGEDEATGGVVNGAIMKVSIDVRCRISSTNHNYWPRTYCR